MKNKYLKKLFLIDGFGAILSAIFLGIILVKLEKYFGIPKGTLYFLASLPCLFAIYDFYCYFKIEKNLEIFLKRIANVNIGYCFLSIILAFYHYKTITHFGWIYIILEIILVLIIVSIELRAVKNHKQKLT